MLFSFWVMWLVEKCCLRWYLVISKVVNNVLTRYMASYIASISNTLQLEDLLYQSELRFLRYLRQILSCCSFRFWCWNSNLPLQVRCRTRCTCRVMSPSIWVPTRKVCNYAISVSSAGKRATARECMTGSSPPT